MQVLKHVSWNTTKCENNLIGLAGTPLIFFLSQIIHQITGRFWCHSSYIHPIFIYIYIYRNISHIHPMLITLIIPFHVPYSWYINPLELICINRPRFLPRGISGGVKSLGFGFPQLTGDRTGQETKNMMTGEVWKNTLGDFRVCVCVLHLSLV